MFYALPAETVFEAKERTKRATFYLFILLVGLYVFFANLLTVSGSLMLRAVTHSTGPVSLPWIVFVSTATAVLFAVIHFLNARAKSLQELLDQIGTRPADPNDQYHAQFIHLVEEAEAATGIHGIQAVVLSTPGCNAFSLQDGKGQAAIGVTDGLLSKLTRPELSAVIAHEAAHLVHEDSKLVTTACFLFGFFGSINEILGKLVSGSSNSYSSFSSSPQRRGGGGVILVVVVLWMISGLGYLLTKLIFMAISREREYLADADGVQICKDPLSMAESLYKISRRYRGNVPHAYQALFIMNPSDSDLDQTEGFFSDLFSNHPPVSKRLDKLLVWAKTDVKTLQALTEKEDRPLTTGKTTPAADTVSSFMAYRDNQWVGPYTPPQLLSMGFMTPATWVCPAGSQQVAKASEAPELLPLFQQQVLGSVTQNACPRCKVSFIDVQYEGSQVEQCSFCKGYLLKAGVLERLITREEKTFTAEEIKKARIWRDTQRGPLKDRDHFPEIKCPLCLNPMGKGIHSMLTQVVIDHCTNESCGAIWCDGGELETIEILIQDAHQPSVR